MPASFGRAACSSSQISVFPGTTQTSSAISRAAGDSLTARASTASRTVVGTVSTAAANTSVTKKGLPPVICAGLSTAGQPAWQAVRRRTRTEATAPFGTYCARQVANDESQRMPRADLIIAIRNREHRGCAMDPSTQILEQVERCFVRPMHVFKHHQRWQRSRAHRAPCRENLFAVRAGVEAANNAPCVWRAISCSGASGEV